MTFWHLEITCSTCAKVAERIWQLKAFKNVKIFEDFGAGEHFYQSTALQATETY